LDSVEKGKKVVGGAQRLRAGAVLQHGSIQIPGALELGDELARPIADALGWTALPDTWTSHEQERIGELATTKYRSSAWNCKR
jgi:lipoate-protein ligase A